MRLVENKAGILIPEVMKDPDRDFLATEIQDADKRLKASYALHRLWEAMDLYRGTNGIKLPGEPDHSIMQARKMVWSTLNKMCLGPDSISCEEYC